MKSIATIGAGIFALCGVSLAQVTYNSTTGQFTCALPNASYCASVSLGSPIIIRCTNGIGQPGNCDDNLDGEFPQGVSYSPCWESSNVGGDAACSKNCIVYGASGSFNGTFTLPNCTAIPSPTSSPSSPSTTPISLSSTAPGIPTPPTIPVFTPTGSSVPYPTGSFPSGTAVGTGGSGSGSGGSGGSGSGGSGSGGSGSGGSGSGGSGSGGSGSGGNGVNGTSPNGSGGSGGSGGSATVTPVGPSKIATGTGPAEYTGTNGASRLGLGMGMILGGVVAGLVL